VKKHYFLGLAAGRRGAWRQLFTHGSKKDATRLKLFLEKKYSGEALLCKNGRSALTLALKAYFDKGDAVIVNGFTCFAAYEAVKAAGLTPVFADISREDLNFNTETLGAAFDNNVRGIIVQNTLGYPVDIVAVEKFAKERNLILIEDLAHCAGVRYPDGRETGTVGVATVLSFGKDKSIDAVSGGAVVLRHPCKNTIKAPSKTPLVSDYLRERFYPMFGAMCRGLSYLHLGGVLMRGLIKIHFVERSADNRLDLERKMPRFEAKLALKQLEKLKKSGEEPLREFGLVNDREKVLKTLRKSGYYFDSLWYEKPVSPVRYYKKVHFDEKKCPIATYVAARIVNLPKYYKKTELELARKIIKQNLAEGGKNGQD